MNTTAQKILVCLTLLRAILNPTRAAEWSHAGPLYDDFSLTLKEGRRTEWFGPLFYSETSDTQKTWGVPPFCWHLRDSATELEQFDFLYPVLTWHRYGTEYRWQLFQLFSFSGGGNRSESAAKRFTLFPLYFQQRSPDPAQNYTACLPFYGHLRNRLFADEMFFVMFPFYCQTHKAGITTDHYLFPLGSRSHGAGLTGWKILPFAGHKHKEPTTRDISFGETETVPGFDRRFVLFPFYFHRHEGVGSDNPTDEVAFIPFYSQLRSPLRDTTTTLWPFFSHVTDREKKYSEWQLPYPIVIFARGEGKTTTRIWPLFSHAQTTNQESTFYLWPAYRKTHVHGETLDRTRLRIFLYLYSDIRQKNLETGKASRRQDFWPFFTRTQDLNGNDRLQIFAPLEPILPFSTSAEREYSPVWSVWRAEKNPSTGAASQSLLWNLYRRDLTPTTKNVSLLFGLFQYHSDLAGKTTRWFYFPAKTNAAAAVFDESLAAPKFDESLMPSVQP
jgi:hypothetical protein